MMIGQKTYAVVIVLLFQTFLGVAAPFSASFEFHKGFVIITASVEGQEGEFILDSGAPGLVLNANHISSTGQSVDMVGAGGGFVAQRLDNQNFEWKNFEKPGIEAYCIDISYLEESLGRKILGLIGLDLFAGHNILIDYAANKLHIDDIPPTQSDRDQVLTFPLYSHDHVMTVVLSHGDTDMRFILDTGSRPNIIHESLLKKIPSEDRKRIGDIIVTSSDLREVTSEEVVIRNFESSDRILDPTTMVSQDLTNLRELTGAQIDGILGHAFFGGSKIWINSERTEMRLVQPNPVLLSLR